MSRTFFFNLIKKIKFQLSCVFFVGIYVIAMLFIEHHQENYGEKIYPILKIKDEVKKIASSVEVGLHINNFPTFEIYQNNFTLDSIVWFRFNIGTESLNTISNFSFKNGEIIYKSLPMIRKDKDKVIVAYQVKVVFKAYLNYKYFPIGDHRLNMIIENRSVTPNELCFDCNLDNFILADDILVSTWHPTKKIVQVGFLKSILEKDEDSELSLSYPCAVFTINFENSSLRDLITLYFPMYVIFFICVFTLMIEIPQYIQRMTIISSAMPILVLFRTVILQLSPSMGEVTKADFTYFLLVFLSLIILLFQAYVSLMMKKINQYSEEIQKIKIAFLEKFNSIMVLVVLLLLIIAITHNVFFV
ncbi:hypothetical protein GF322_04440 [Candidatus Dependentiae bacterium]|nr:hypothetical protein [Candidatus Dependentiae bacterium]